MNGNGDILFMLCLIVALFIWYIYQIFKIERVRENRKADMCGYSRKSLRRDYHQMYFQEVLGCQRPTVKDCLQYEPVILKQWLLNKEYDPDIHNQCILERDFESLYDLISFFSGEEAKAFQENPLLHEMRKHYKE